LQQVDFDLCRIDDHLRNIGDRLGPFELHGLVLVLEPLDSLEQVIAQIFNVVFHARFSCLWICRISRPRNCTTSFSGLGRLWMLLRRMFSASVTHSRRSSVISLDTSVFMPWRNRTMWPAGTAPCAASHTITCTGFHRCVGRMFGLSVSLRTITPRLESNFSVPIGT